MRALLLLAMVALCGCTAPVHSTLAVDFLEHDDVEVELRYHAGDRTSLDIVHAAGRDHADGVTALDLLEHWRRQADIEVLYDDFGEFGFSVRAIDGVEADYTNGSWWLLVIDGEPACTGLEQTLVTPGMHVALVQTPSDDEVALDC